MGKAGQYLCWILSKKTKLDNEIMDIQYDDLRPLYNDFKYDINENLHITQMSYQNRSCFDGQKTAIQAILENTYQNPKTEGLRKQYPHGVVLQQAGFRHFYRGENRQYKYSESTLCRKLRSIEDNEEKELFRLVADMRVHEFSMLINRFQHVNDWSYSDVLYECIAQHYGFETAWLDITSDLNMAMFFATCFWKDGKWYPLTRNETEDSEEARYGMLFHMPSYQSKTRWSYSLDCFSELEACDLENLIYPIGFQPFMRCHMQHGYGIYMRNPRPLQDDFFFEKLRFRHDEELSKRCFDRMQGGELVYPHEGLGSIRFLIDEIASLQAFTNESLVYALKRSHEWRVKDRDTVVALLNSRDVCGKSIRIVDRPQWHLSSGRRKHIDREYEGFDVERIYGVKPVSRPAITEEGEITGPPVYEPYMMFGADDECKGRVDFEPRDMVEANIWTDVTLYMLRVMMTADSSDYVGI